VQRFYITTPIYYVNAKPHLGHAYTTIVADALARFHRAMGFETRFLTGTDEHGDKIVQAAGKNGEQPQEYTDRISGLFRDLWPELNISNDDFIRTTEPRHKKVVQAILQKVYDSGDIYFGEYGGHYCYGCERFYTEKELEDGLCPQHKVKPEFIQEKNYFFRMSRHQQWLIEHIKANPDFVRPERYRNEVLSLLESGALDDLCISRPKTRLTWGIELPFDTDYVTYVWFDALLNYVTALDWPDGENFGKFWPVAQHLVAKDILKPHAVFWPTMLRAAGFEPYRHLNVHGYWLVKDTKMSKSLGNVVEPLDMARHYGLDPFRYFLLREMHYGNDASFSEEALVARLNADLANDLGNLFNRVLSMTRKYFGGVVPAPQDEADWTDLDRDLKELALTSCANFQQLFGCVRFSYGLEALWELVRGLNKHVDASAPWTLFKQGDTARLGTVMYCLLECMRKVALHLWPVMPESSEKMLAQLGVGVEHGAVDSGRLAGEAETWGVLAPGTALSATSQLFPRVELEAAPGPDGTDGPGGAEAPAAAKDGRKDAKAAAPVEEAAKAEPAPEIEYEDFAKVDLRVGTVVAAEQHPKADRLIRMDIDCGEEGGPRQVVGGLAEHFAPEDLIGRQVVVVANLKPRKLRGLTSHGMVLAVRDGEAMRLLTPSEPVNPGRKVS
jgi:methionyl-tRNA synthetase